MSQAQVDHATLTITVDGVTYSPRFDLAKLGEFERVLGTSAIEFEADRPVALRYPGPGSQLFLYFLCGGEAVVRMDSDTWESAFIGHTYESLRTFVYLLVARFDAEGAEPLAHHEGGVN